MSEKEIRAALEKVCDDLDLKARLARRRGKHRIVLPLMLGTGLAIAACGDDETDEPMPVYGVPSGQTTTTSDTGTGGTAGGGGDTATGGGVVGGGGAGGEEPVGGATMEYMAPDPD